MLKLIEKAAAILDAFTAETPERSLSDLTAHLGMPKATVHHILAALKKVGWISQDRTTKKYRLGARLWQMGCTVVHALNLRDQPRPHILRLAALTGETVHLSIIDSEDPGHVVYIDKIESDHPVRAYSIVGGRAPSYCVASGKAILAFNPDLLKPLLRRKLKAYSPASIIASQALAREMAAIRAAGYAVNRGEYRADVIGLAAPIRNHEGAVIAAVGISGPAYRMAPPFLAKAAPTVIETANRISRELGYILPPPRRRAAAGGLGSTVRLRPAATP